MFIGVKFLSTPFNRYYRIMLTKNVTHYHQSMRSFIIFYLTNPVDICNSTKQIVLAHGETIIYLEIRSLKRNNISITYILVDARCVQHSHAFKFTDQIKIDVKIGTYEPYIRFCTLFRLRLRGGVLLQPPNTSLLFFFCFFLISGNSDICIGSLNEDDESAVG